MPPTLWCFSFRNDSVAERYGAPARDPQRVSRTCAADGSALVFRCYRIRSIRQVETSAQKTRRRPRGHWTRGRRSVGQRKRDGLQLCQACRRRRATATRPAPSASMRPVAGSGMTETDPYWRRHCPSSRWMVESSTRCHTLQTSRQPHNLLHRAGAGDSKWCSSAVSLRESSPRLQSSYKCLRC